MLLLAGLVIAYLRFPARRRTMVFGAIFGLPLVVLELWLTGNIQRLGITSAQQILEVVTVTVSMCSASGLAALFADVIVQRHWGAVAHPARSQLWWFGIGIGVATVLFAVGQPAPVALMFGLALNGIIIVVLERELLWDVVLGSAAFATLFILIDLAFGIRASGDITRLLVGNGAFGVTVAGLPLERLLTVGLVGAIIGPLFSATKFRRSPATEQRRIVPHPKLAAVTAGLILGTGMFMWMLSTFVLPPHIDAIHIVPEERAGVDVTGITIWFNRPIDRQSLTLVSSPMITGTWSFAEPETGDHGYRQATIIFDAPLASGTTYVMTVTGIQSVWRLRAADVQFRFTTASVIVAEVPSVPLELAPVIPTPTPAPEPVPVVTPPVVEPPAPAPTPVATQHILSIALDYQDQALSCEAAALKMALAGKGVRVSEKQIMDIVGYDATPHRGEVWGDPNVAFVGSIAGHQNTTGYGVHWDPIAKAARTWRSARAITNGTTKQLAAEIYADHPVVIWGTLGTAYRDDWQTPSGATVLTWKGEHARTVIGVIGTADNPTAFVVNDPIVGRVTWSTAKLDANWRSFGRAAVIVE